jgi:hypothetical protein
MAENSLRGSIIVKWEDDGSPELVQYDQVLRWATESDSHFRSRGLNPARAFRKHLYNQDSELKPYLLRMHFPFRIVL